MTPFDQELLRHVPDALESSCRHAGPLTPDFDSTVSCRAGGPVSSLRYSHARSGFLLYNFFMAGMPRAGLPAMATVRQPTIIGSCSTGELPALNTVAPSGLRGRIAVPEKASRGERLGYVRCYERDGRSRLEWTTEELGIYAVAAGKDLAALYEWWRRAAGPEP